MADRAGVAKSIASRVLNGTAVTVRPETRARVLGAAQDLGYQAHPAARALNHSQTRTVGVLIPTLTNVVWSRVVRGAVKQAFRREFAVLTAEDTAEEVQSLRRLAKARLLDGLIIAAARPGLELAQVLDDVELPYVFVLRGVPRSGRNVLLDDDQVGRLAVEHLTGLGHVRIGHVAGPRNLDSGRRRARGFAAAMRTRGLDAGSIAHGAFSERGGSGATAALLARHPDLTAVFAASLPQAVGAQFQAARLGRLIPDDLSVVCYDDMPLADYLQPPLTTIRVPLEELGAAAFDALHRQIDGGPPTDLVVPTRPEVIIRASTAPVA